MSQANLPPSLSLTAIPVALPAVAPTPLDSVESTDEGEALDEELTYQSLPLKLSEPMSAKVEYMGRMPAMPYPLVDDEDE